MRRWLGRETPPPAPSLRDTLFGDLPLAQWGPAGHGEGEPWTSFATAREAEARGDTARAVAALQAIVAMPALESRHYLEAWHALRRHGAPPPADRAAALLGVVVEVALPEGLDLLAAYADRTARYYNYAGPGIVWERPDASLDPWIDAVLAAARAIAGQIGPWDGEPSRAPAHGRGPPESPRARRPRLRPGEPRRAPDGPARRPAPGGRHRAHAADDRAGARVVRRRLRDRIPRAGAGSRIIASRPARPARRKETA